MTTATAVDEATPEIDDADMAHAMKQFGGGFVRALAECFYRADSDNRARLHRAFPEYVANYRELAARRRDELIDMRGR